MLLKRGEGDSRGLPGGRRVGSRTWMLNGPRRGRGVRGGPAEGRGEGQGQVALGLRGSRSRPRTR